MRSFRIKLPHADGDCLAVLTEKSRLVSCGIENNEENSPNRLCRDLKWEINSQANQKKQDW